MNPRAKTRWIVEKAKSLGWNLCGVARVEAIEEESRLGEWLERGYAGEMRYMHDPRRASPRRVLTGARNVIVCALNYNTPFPYSNEAPANAAPLEKSAQQDETGPNGWISRYAWGDDYHNVLGRKLESLLAAMREKFSEPFDARAYVDTGPIIERLAAKFAGIGWLGKNTCLINQELGSWLFLGAILTTLELEPTVAAGASPPPDLCGTCRRCLDACPTQAFVAPYLLDARRCISYLTIELRGPIPEEFRAPTGRMIFGCDICQDVCPWNRKAPETTRAEFFPRLVAQKGAGGKAPGESEAAQKGGGAGNGSQTLLEPSLGWLASLGENEFREVFRASAVKRAKWRGFLRNVCVALGNSRLTCGSHDFRRVVQLLEQLAASEDALVAEHAGWALARLRMPASVPVPGRIES